MQEVLNGSEPYNVNHQDGLGNTGQFPFLSRVDRGGGVSVQSRTRGGDLCGQEKGTMVAQSRALRRIPVRVTAAFTARSPSLLPVFSLNSLNSFSAALRVGPSVPLLIFRFLHRAQTNC